MARYIYQGTTKDGTGKVVCEATISIYLAGGYTVASVYTAITGGTAVNSVTSGSETSPSPGYFGFWVDTVDYSLDQRFRIVISKTGFNPQIYDYVFAAINLVHKTRHQDTGADEISVAGLSGLLADDQHVLDTEVINLVYPVGSIYVSVVATNPGTLFGVGIWVAFGAGRVPVGLDAGQTEFDTVEETGGAKTVSIAHTHTGPSHTHTGPSHTHTGPSHAHAIFVSGTDLAISAIDPNATGNTGAGGTGATGAGGTGVTGADGTGATGAMSANAIPSILQPYIVVYMWKRTA